MTYEEWDLADLAESVEVIKAMYIKARDARRPSDHLWNEYARALYVLRLHKRSMKDG